MEQHAEKKPTGVGAAMADDRDKLINLERRGAEHKGKQTSVQQHRANNDQRRKRPA